MSHVNWLEILGWHEQELDDLRFVGYSYIKQGNYDLALTFFEALTVLSTKHAYDFQTLGALYLQKNNNLMALSTLEKALKLEPYHYPTQLNRVKALFGLGYKRQGLMAAKSLQTCPLEQVANQATALVLAYG